MKVGILGNGQLARMLALAGKPLGLDFTFYDPNPEGCANVLGEYVQAEFTDSVRLQAFLDRVDVVTLENENIPEQALNRVPRDKLFPPAIAVLKSQDRLLEKQFLQRLDIPLASYYPIDEEADLLEALQRQGGPLIIKTRRLGYDGRGQAKIHSFEEVRPAWRELQQYPLIAEEKLSFEREISLISVRAQSGEIRCYPLTENTHHNGILHTSVLRQGDALQGLAEAYGRRVLESLDYVGVLGFEFFQVGDRLLANEIAPRVHNTGHWTIDGADISQFENHLRAVLGWPLGSTLAHSPCIMYNVIGSFPDKTELAAIPGAHIHDYQKAPMPLRKIGHVTLCSQDSQVLLDSERRVHALVQTDAH
jgi:5-(carboxyamino)imidazole ribonucleotide synthase